MTFYLYVCYAEHRQNKGKDRRAHFHRGMARLGIDTAGVCYADRKINVTHDLREYDIGNIRDLDRLTCLSIGKADPFKSGRFDVRGREPIGKRIYLRYDIFLVIYLLQTVLDIRYPTATLERTDRFGGLYLISGISERMEHKY